MDKIETAQQLLLDYLKDQMVAKNITQEMLAEKTGFARSNISRMLSGRYSPTLSNLLILCDALNCYIFIIDKEADDDLAKTMRERYNRPAQEN